jgi:NTP pyrophosphatase (non-canonical NTP hydrolase)
MVAWKKALELLHVELVGKLQKPGKDIMSEMTPDQAQLWHMASGLAEEASEVLSVIIKHVVKGLPLDVEHLEEELGDVEFTLQGIRQLTGIQRESCLVNNMKKLNTRYKSGTYSNEAAQKREDKNV